MIASELRVGNWVKIPLMPVEVTISQIGPHDFTNGIVEMCHPIPLTEEWLLKFGFSRIEESPFDNIKLKYWVNNRVCLFYNESPPYNSYLLGFADQRFGQYSVVTGNWIDSVHTLQNAFHALTAQELTIKE